jgi:hypothetical protein
MTDEKLDKILGTEDELMPSSGFLATVMERIEEEAAAPPPIPFPWKRAVPGIVLTAGVLGWSAVELIRQGIPEMGRVALAAPQIPAGFARPLEQAGWVALALGVSLVSWLFSRRIAGRSGLL